MHKILVVDDEPNMLELYLKELGEEGYEVKTVCCGEEALKVAQTEKFDLVILDIKMDKMDGLSTLSELKKLKKGIPVILNSAYTTYKSDFHSWLADSYMVKSSNLSELKNKIGDLIKV
ncbi:MAG: hypothetical protein AMJ90_03405 [candidate division Zixibacteria bacterium SM23_73_2]|nr:MAG: hypothetical protein AMJ90_03405 [candidate division Zixibacteria bacterium SM23_73_2]